MYNVIPRNKNFRQIGLQYPYNVGIGFESHLLSVHLYHLSNEAINIKFNTNVAEI